MGFILGIPLVTTSLFNDPIYGTYLLIISTFFLEYLAYPVGVLVGLNPLNSTIITITSTLGYYFLFYESFNSIDKFERIKRKLDDVRKTKWIKIINEKGLPAIPIVVLVGGVLVVAAIAYITKMDFKKTSVITFISITLGVILTATGISFI